MKKILLAILVFCSALFAEVITPKVETGSFKLETKIGEEAINRILRSYIIGEYAAEVPNCGRVKLAINDIGIDLQTSYNEENVKSTDVIFRWEYTFVAETITGSCEDLLALFNKKFHYTTSNKVTITKQELTDAVEVLIDFDASLEEWLGKYGYPAPLKNLARTVFQKRVLFEQKYGEILKQTKSLIEREDVYVDLIDVDFKIGKVPDHITIDFLLNTRSEEQVYYVDGKNIVSNKRFRPFIIIHSTDKASTCKTPQDEWITSYPIKNCGLAAKLGIGDIVMLIQSSQGGIFQKRFRLSDK